MTDIIRACEDDNLLGHAFPDRSSWQSWFAALKAIFGLPMSDEDFVRFKECTGRQTTRSGGYSETSFCAGRRGGKSRIMAVAAAYLGCFVDWRPHLAAGETGTVMVIAQNRQQAETILN